MKASFRTLASCTLLGLALTACTDDTDTFSLQEAQVPLAPVIRYAEGGVTDGFIVVLKATTKRDVATGDFSKAQQASRSEAVATLRQHAIPEDKLDEVYSTALHGFSARLSSDEVDRLRQDPAVDYIEQDQIISLVLPTAKPGGGGGGSASQTVPYGITRVNGGVSGVGAGRAYIIDSGIDLDHEDLNVNVGLSRSFLNRGGPDDENGHGTHVAGTVAAKDNGVGVIGVAAGAEVVAVRVLDRRGSGSNSGVIAGVDYVAATASSGDVANMSLGGGISTALDAAVVAASKTCPFVLAAGNSSADASTSSPARVNGAGVYTISAMDINDNFASFSNYGAGVDYCAPGVSVLSTYKGGGYATLSGTSMASPHAAGVVLLGSFSTDGTVNNDPDGQPDRIIVH